MCCVLPEDFGNRDEFWNGGLGKYSKQQSVRVLQLEYERDFNERGASVEHGYVQRSADVFQELAAAVCFGGRLLLFLSENSLVRPFKERLRV